MSAVTEANLASIMEVVDAWDGTFVSEIGSVLSDLALLSGLPYKTVSACVLELERLGVVAVERFTRPEAHRANRLISIARLP